MKTKTQFITKLLAVFAVISFTVGAMLFAINPNLGVANSVNAADVKIESTSEVKDVGFSGNVFKAANMYWGNGNATTGGPEYFTLATNTDDGYDLKITAKADTANYDWIIHDTKQEDKYWWAGVSYKVSFQYMASEGANCSVQFVSLINGEGATQTGTSLVNPSTTLQSAEYTFTVAEDYVHNSNNGHNTLRIIIKNFKEKDVLFLKNIKVEVLDNHIENQPLCGISGITCTNASDYAESSYTTVDGETVYDIKGLTGASSKNYCLRTEFFPWYSGITYELSFYIRTVKTLSPPSWYLYPRAMIAGNGVSTLDCGINNYQLKGVISDWCKYTFKYTPTKTDLSSVNNYFGFVMGLGKDEEIQIKGLTVTAAGAKSVSSLFKYVGDRTTDNSVSYAYSNETVEGIDNYDTVYGGKVNVVKCKTDLESGANRLIWDRYITWDKDVTYTIAFKVKTNETSNTVRFSAQYKTAGHDAIECLSAYNVIIEDVENANTAREWKTVIKTFTLADMEKAAEKVDLETDTPNYVRFVLSGLKASDEVYFTDVKIYANLCTVTVNDGTNTTKENFVSGTEKTVTLPEVEVAAGKNHIGWDINGTFYQKDGLQSVTVDSDTTIKAVIIDFATDAGAYLRVVDSAEDTGIRFTATADKAAIEEALKNYGTVTEYGMHITAEGISGYLDIVTEKWKEGEKGFASSIVGFNENTKDFYTVKFTAEAYLKLKLNNGDTITIYAGGCAAEKSIVGMATDAYNDVSDSEDTEHIFEVTTVDGKTKYSKWDEDQRAILAIFMNAANTTEENS